MGLKSRKYYTWSMRRIKAIVNGDAVNETDMSDDVKAMNIFKEKNPELLLVAHRVLNRLVEIRL